MRCLIISSLCTFLGVAGVLASPSAEAGLVARQQSCTFNAGQQGTCISVTECRSRNGQSEAGKIRVALSIVTLVRNHTD